MYLLRMKTIEAKTLNNGIKERLNKLYKSKKFKDTNQT